VFCSHAPPRHKRHITLKATLRTLCARAHKVRENRQHGSEGGEGESPSRPLFPPAGSLDVETLRREAIPQRLQMCHGGDDQDTVTHPQSTAYEPLKRIEDNAIMLIRSARDVR
jgi:hypothetical protein